MLLSIHLNSINPHIKFTVEEERDRKLPFLDLLITRKNDNSLSYAVYRKNTHTGNYLNFKNNHPMHHKRAVIKSLSDRAKRLCSEDTLGPELNTIGEDLAVNGYPRSFVESVMKNNRNDNISTNEPIRYIPAPYIKATSERVNKILRPYNLRLGSKPTNTLKSKLCILNDKITMKTKSIAFIKFLAANAMPNILGRHPENSKHELRSINVQLLLSTLTH